MKLVVIEGAGKKETIEKYLGAGYKVFATKGHIRDLPTKTLAVNVKKNYEPKYVVMEDKADIVKALISIAGKADEVLLATDPDREGEAISWHIANILELPHEKKSRIVFNEISKKAIQKALGEPRVIDLSLVDAQQARRVLDRLVGYKLSPVICKKIQNKLSAGRVQSVALRLVVEREREILKFIPEEYWPFSSKLEKNGTSFKASLTSYNNIKFKISNEQQLNKVKDKLVGKDYVVSNVKKSVTKSRPSAPFITSSMQQDALNKLGMSLKQTTSIAQALYEGVEVPGEGKVALVTYIRTDSTRVSADAIADARNYAMSKFGNDYVPAKPNIYASKASAQDAHEAIRPISIERDPDSLKNVLGKFHYRLYKLIYDRFLASQMSDATYNSLTVDVDCDKFLFRVTGKTPLFAGFTAVYNTFVEENPNVEGDSQDKIPSMEVGDKLKWLEFCYEQKFTKPIARFTEASLVKMMEEKGIGRPATYTPTITTLANRLYTEKDGKYIKPTELGCKVTDMLVTYFPEVLDVQFTASMEEKLDSIEFGGKVWQTVVDEFYKGFEDKIAAAMGDSFSLKEPDETTDIDCELCDSKMVIKKGRFGKFLACPNYPKCKNTKQIDENGNITAKEVKEVVESDEVCEKCGSNMVVKKGKFGEFLACPNYPKCKNIRNINSPAAAEPEGAPCPLCGKAIKKIVTKRGVFFGCSDYPNCKFTSNDIVAEGKCPNCGSHLIKKANKDGSFATLCGNKNCDYVLTEDQNFQDTSKN